MLAYAYHVITTCRFKYNMVLCVMRNIKHIAIYWKGFSVISPAYTAGHWLAGRTDRDIYIHIFIYHCNRLRLLYLLLLAQIKTNTRWFQIIQIQSLTKTVVSNKNNACINGIVYIRVESWYSWFQNHITSTVIVGQVSLDRTKRDASAIPP